MEELSVKQKFHRLLRSRGFLIGMLIVGFLILLYPLVSNQYYKIVQKSFNREYEKTVEGMRTEEVALLLERARHFNKELYLQGGEALYTTQKLDFVMEAMKEETYPSYFGEGKLIGTVDIPKIKVSLPIFVGVEEEILQRSCGFMLPSSLPVGGESTHSILTAHRGLPQSRLFRDLGELEKGDLFFVKILGETLAYETQGKSIIVPTDFSQLGITQGVDEVTLLTCHPYTINSHRLLVKGDRVDYTPEVEKEAETQQKEYAWKLFFEQYKEYFYGFFIFALIVAGVSLREMRKKRRAKNR